MMINARLLLSTILFVCSGIIFKESLSYEYYGKVVPGPGLFPQWISGILLVLSVIYLIDSFRSQPVPLKDILPTGKGLKKVLSMFAAMLLLIILVPYTGFLIASFIMLLILFLLEYKWYSSLIISGVVGFTAFYVFKYFLSVPLPVGPLGF
jgi:Tripartite tricarboxylate transporter TctB family.